MEGARELTFFLPGASDNWDLANAEFRSRLMRWCVVDGLTVRLAIQDTKALSPDTRRELAGLAEMGVKIVTLQSAKDGPVTVLQTAGENSVWTLYSDREGIAVPGEQWLAGDSEASLVMAASSQLIQTDDVDTSAWRRVPAGTVKLQIKHELDGALTDFGKRFLLLLSKAAPNVLEQIRQDDLLDVSYSDRYLKSPWTLLLLSEILRSIARGAAVPLSIEAVRGETSNAYRGRIDNDWTNPAAQAATMQSWLMKLGFSTVQVKLAASRRDMPHYRQLILKYRSGGTIIIDFDQGMGYWNLKPDRSFDSFNEAASESVREAQMARTREKARVACSGPSYTPVYVETRLS